MIAAAPTAIVKVVHPRRVTSPTRRGASIRHAGDHGAACAPGQAAMLTEAVGFALLAALGPAAGLVSAVLLGSANPRRTALIYLAGAVVMTAVMATIVFVVLHAGHAYKPRQHQTRYGVRLGLGLLMLLGGGYLWRRGPKQRDPADEDKGIISRLLARPGAK